MENNTPTSHSFLPLARQNEQHWLTLGTIEGVLIIIINTITITTFVKNARIFGKAVYTLINLAVADLLYGCCFMSVAIYNWIASFDILSEEEYFQTNAILVPLLQLCLACSGTCLVMVSVDRFLAAYSPFKYRATQPKVHAIAIAIGWCLCVSVGVAHFVNSTYSAKHLTNLYVILILFGLIVIISSYTAIFLKIRWQGRLSNVTAQAAELRERNMAYTLMLMTFCSLLTWLPFGLVISIANGTALQLTEEIIFAAVMLLASNSFINPIIYALRMKYFRKEMLRLLGCSPRSQIHPSTAS